MSVPGLDIEVTHAAGLATVALRGELDVDTEPEVEAALEAASQQAVHVALDLRGLDFIDSTGLRLVLVWARRLRDRGVAFAVVRGPDHVQRPFASAGLDTLLPFVDEPPA